MLASRKLTAAHRASGWLVFLERVLLHALNTKCRRAVIFTEIFIADNCATEASARVSIGSATPPALEPCGMPGAEAVNPKIGNLCSSKSFSPNSFERSLVPTSNPMAPRIPHHWSGVCRSAVRKLSAFAGNRSACPCATYIEIT